MDCRPPGSSIHGIFQARVLEWVAISFSNSDIKVVTISIQSYKFKNLSNTEHRKIKEGDETHVVFNTATDQINFG